MSKILTILEEWDAGIHVEEDRIRKAFAVAQAVNEWLPVAYGSKRESDPVGWALADAKLAILRRADALCKESSC